MFESSHIRAHPLWLELMSKIHIPTPLRQYVGKQSTVEVKGGTVAEAMDALVAQHPEVRRHLYTEEGKLRAFVNLYVNDEDIRYLQKEATTVNEGDNISIVPSIAGGRMEDASSNLCHPSRRSG
jgi:adenylyltransferase/sulfurtransferase